MRAGSVFATSDRSGTEFRRPQPTLFRCLYAVVDVISQTGLGHLIQIRILYLESFTSSSLKLGISILVHVTGLITDNRSCDARLADLDLRSVRVCLSGSCVRDYDVARS